MRVALGLVTFLCIGMASQTFAADPPSTAPASEQAPAIPAPSAASEAAPSPSQPAPSVAAPTAPSAASADKPSSSSTLTDKEVKVLRAQGYKPVVRHGETLYCREEIPLGSVFGKQTCGTAEQLAEVARNSQEVTQRVQRNTSPMMKGAP